MAFHGTMGRVSLALANNAVVNTHIQICGWPFVLSSTALLTKLSTVPYYLAVTLERILFPV